jgi:hypothetical protein
MQILQSGTKLKKFHLSHCGVQNDEMKELKNLMKQTPILPNVVRIGWYDSADAADNVDWDYKQHESLLETFQHTFPHAKWG